MTAFPIGYHDAVALAEIHESPWNPRKTFDPVKLGELAASLKEKGCLTPLVVRPRKGGGVEIGAGHRRRRAAELATVVSLPVVVRAMTDAEFLELLVIENDHHEDVHELEQALGYKRLMLQDQEHYTAKRIAERIGRSEKFIYDRLKLLSMIPLAQHLFLAGKMTAGHAILLARLTPEQQKKAIEIDDGDGRYRDRSGLFQGESAGLFDDDELEGKATKKDPLAAFEGYKPVSVRELDGWIAEHIRFDPKKADAFLFPAVVEAVSTAPKDLVPLSWENSIADDARDPKVRTWRPGTWKEVKDPAKACKYTQAGIIVVGPGRGDVLQVCLNSHRDQCATHWSKESKEAAQMRKIRAGGGSTRASDRNAERASAQVEREKRERAAADALRARFKLARPKFLAAIAAAVEKATVADVAAPVLQACRPWNGGAGMKEYSTPGRTPDSILRYCAFAVSFREISSNDWELPSILTKQGKLWGLDVTAILEAAAPAPKVEKKAEAKAPAKKAAAAKPKKKAAKK